MEKANRDKCKNCKYWCEEFDGGWSYQMVKWCNKGIEKPEDVESCECHKEKYGVMDYIRDTAPGWMIILLWVILSICYSL